MIRLRTGSVMMDRQQLEADYDEYESDILGLLDSDDEADRREVVFAVHVYRRAQDQILEQLARSNDLWDQTV